MADTDKPDATRFNSLPWIVISGFLGLYAVNTPASTASRDATTAVAKQDQTDALRTQAVPPDPLQKTLEGFHFSYNHDEKWKPDDIGHEVHGYSTEFIIATVPDPIDSPFGYAFDQVVDAIQRGVQQKDGYLLDRAWLPWEADRRRKATDKKEDDSRRTMPGVLLFRHGKDEAKGVKQPGQCVVFLVGETPMGGIHKKAFWKCLTLIAESGLQAEEPIRVVGPYFTGSQTSLQFLIDDWMRYSSSSRLTSPVPSRFKIMIGNASGVRMKEYFRDTWGPEKIEIGATVVSGRVQLNSILHFLAERDAARSGDAISSQVVKTLPGRIAILSESNTGFGKMFAAYGEQNDVVVLRFPLHIAKLKSEYAQLFHKQDEQVGLQATTVSPAGFEDAGGAPEGVPAQGGAATIATTNAVLANILSTISRERFRYVGVMATDTRDKLFLIRLIREYCPDVHVFVTQGDLLLTHPDYRYHMKGVIVGSTYPLYPPNQQWVRPDAPERLLVSSAASQGYYNATLAILGLHGEMLEYGPPSFATGPDVPLDRPPVWVSEVAPNGTLVPLQLFTGYDNSGGEVWRRPDGGAVPPATGLQYPGSLALSGLVLIVFWLVLLVKCWRNQGIWAVNSPADRASHAGVFRTVLLGSQMVFAVALIALTSARAEHTEYQSPGDIAALTVSSLAWLLLLLTTLRGVSFHRSQTDSPDGRRWRWDIVNLLIIIGLVLFTSAFLWRFWGVSDRAHRALFFVRAVDLASGLSPLTPLFLMCLAVAAGAYFHLERRELARRSRVPSPFPSGPDHKFEPLIENDRQLKVEMTPGRFWKHYRISLSVLFVALAVAGATIWRDTLPTIEGNVWDAAFAIGFGSIFAFATLTIFQTFVLWRQTKQLLAQLARMPMMRVFSRLPAKVASVVTKHLYTRSTQPLLLQIGVHQLRALADVAKTDAEAPEAVRNLGSLADKAEAHLQALNNTPHGKLPDPEEAIAVRELLSKAASHGLEALSPRWKSLPTDEAFGVAPATPAASEPEWVAKAEELVATQTVNYLSQFFIQLRSLMLAVLVCSSLLLISATSYPFHPERLLLVFLLGLVGAGLAGVVYVFVDMSRDETVGRVSKSTGRFALDSGFVTAFFTYIVPTVGLLAAQLSGTFRWALEPILRVVK
jgi:hypothetical protein